MTFFFTDNFISSTNINFWGGQQVIYPIKFFWWIPPLIFLCKSEIYQYFSVFWGNEFAVFLFFDTFHFWNTLFLSLSSFLQIFHFQLKLFELSFWLLQSQMQWFSRYYFLFNCFYLFIFKMQFRIWLLKKLDTIFLPPLFILSFMVSYS